MHFLKPWRTEMVVPWRWRIIHQGLRVLATCLCFRDRAKCFRYVISFILHNILVPLGFDQSSRTIVSNRRDLFEGSDLTKRWQPYCLCRALTSVSCVWCPKPGWPAAGKGRWMGGGWEHQGTEAHVCLAPIRTHIGHLGLTLKPTWVSHSL